MAANKLTNEEWTARMTTLMSQLENKTKVSPVQLNELFTLYNDRFDPQILGKHCSNCVARVHRRMLLAYAEQNKLNETNKEGAGQTKTESSNTTDPEANKD